MPKRPKKHANPPPKYRKKHKTNPSTGAAAVAAPITTAGAVTPSAGAEPSQVLTLLPMAPLICRSGRPFDDQAGADRARFPPPSTVAGCIRTAWARETGQDFGAHLMALGVDGPLLARAGAGGGLCLYAPRPADALYFGQKDTACCIRAEPTPFTEGSGADLPDGLLPVVAKAPDGKETKGPAWWAWDDLLGFRRGDDELSYSRLSNGGWSPPEGDLRTHVAIEPTTFAAKTGQLFQTEGLDFSPPGGMADGPTSDLRLLVRVGKPLSAAMAHLGGERRLAWIEPRESADWPVPPDGWLAQVARAKGLTLTLLTPALFAAGYRPGWLDEEVAGSGPLRRAGSPPGLPGLRVVLCAAALGRWQPHSGWDLERQVPRAGRKLVPAGAVYWFRLVGDPSAENLAALWLSSICDHEQDRRDGFGLVLPAPWRPPATENRTTTLGEG